MSRQSYTDVLSGLEKQNVASNIHSHAIVSAASRLALIVQNLRVNQSLFDLQNATHGHTIQFAFATNKARAADEAACAGLRNDIAAARAELIKCGIDPDAPAPTAPPPTPPPPTTTAAATNNSSAGAGAAPPAPVSNGSSFVPMTDIKSASK